MSKKARSEREASLPPKAVIYARVSSKEQSEGYSIGAQLDLLRDYSRNKVIPVVREFVDVETAKQAGRLQFGEMVRFLQAEPTVRIILCEKTDRLYRNFRDYGTIEDLGVQIHLVKESEVFSKDSKSHQKLVHGLKVLMAKNYLDNLSEEVKKGMAKKAETGTWPGYAPIGYANVCSGKKHSIEPDELRAHTIGKMFEWYATGAYSLGAVRDMAADAGLRSKNGKAVSRSVVEHILKNCFYVGQFEWNGRIYQGDHLPIVSRELFERVQAVHERRGYSAPRGNHRFPYVGLLTCTKCGCAITAEIKKGRYIYYHCTGGKGDCPTPRIRQDRLEELLGGLAASIRIDQDIADWMIRALRESHKDEKQFHDSAVADLNRQHKLLQDRLDRMYLDKLDGKVDEQFWGEKSGEWRSEQNRVRQSIGEHERANCDYIDAGVRIIELAQRAHSLWVRQEPDERRKLLKILLSNCTFDGVTLYPTYRKPFCWLAEGPECTDWHAWQELNPQPLVLETSALPIELHACDRC
jgi:site-specific DNA recombinase